MLVGPYLCLKFSSRITKTINLGVKYETFCIPVTLVSPSEKKKGTKLRCD